MAQFIGYSIVETIVLFVWAIGALFIAAPLLLIIISLFIETAPIIVVPVLGLAFMIHNFSSPPFVVFMICLTLWSIFTAFFRASNKEKRVFICLFAGPMSLGLAYLTRDMF